MTPELHPASHGLATGQVDLDPHASGPGDHEAARPAGADVGEARLEPDDVVAVGHVRGRPGRVSVREARATPIRAIDDQVEARARLDDDGNLRDRVASAGPIRGSRVTRARADVL